LRFAASICTVTGQAGEAADLAPSRPPPQRLSLCREILVVVAHCPDAANLYASPPFTGALSRGAARACNADHLNAV
jgi:hypothetical protein